MIDKIREYSKVTRRFHMPGHNGVNLDDEIYKNANYDITELDFSDNLQSPDGMILDLENRLSRLYHAKKSLILTQGATAGIETALLVAKEEKGRLYLLGETHKSCMSFASVIGLDLIMLSGIDEAVDKASLGEWIYVTTPNYYGMVMDITRVLDARKNGSAVIVDEAHGAHFVLSDLLPTSLSNKADFVVESMHKTLPVFTGGAVLNINNDKYIEMTEFFKNKIHSTSPSYMIMQSIDYTVDLFEKSNQDVYIKVKDAVDSFKAALDDRFKVADTDDFTRVVIECDNADLVAEYLQNNDTYIELFDRDRLVLIVTPFNYIMLDDVAKILKGYKQTKILRREIKVDFALKRASSLKGKLEFLPLDESDGKVSMSEIAIYPPGVPIARTGDIISREVIQYIKANKERIVGLIGDTIAVREVCEEN